MGGGNRGRKKRGVWKIICNFAIGYFAQRHKSSNNQNSIMLNNNFTGNPIGGGNFESSKSNTPNNNQIVSLIWNIADDVLRDVFLRGQYRDVILPMVVLDRKSVV